MKAVIIGGSGYIGSELIRLLLGHPEVELMGVTSRRHAGKGLEAVHPNLTGVTDLIFTEEVPEADFVFFASPKGVAMEKAPDHLDSGRKVVDLGPDFRIRDPAVYRQFYDLEHTCTDLLEEAVYGLTEVNRGQVRDARLVANPGCHATAASLAVHPLRGLDLERIVIDSYTGSSGSGIEPSKYTHHPERAQTLRPYSRLSHRHQPEVEQVLSGPVTFTPHSAPVVRGILSTTHVFGEIDPELHQKAYANEHFIRFTQGPSTANITLSNFVDMRIETDGDHTTIITALDNLVKGGAGQAVQNMNVMSGFDETAGLNQLPSHP